MKKLTALLLALVMLLSLAACGGNNAGNSANSGNTNPSANDQQQEVTDGDDVPGETESVGINFSEKTLTSFGESFQLVPTGDLAANAKISFSTNNDGVAVVSQDGTITAAGPGEAVITMTVDVDGKKNELTCAVTCTWEENVPTLSRKDFTLKNVGDTFKLEAMYILEGSTITWSSADEAVAIVAEDGTVTAVGAGHTTITATVDEGGDFYELTCIVRCSAAEAGGVSGGAADLSFVHEAAGAVGLGLVEDAELIENFFPGLTAAAEESIVYMSMMGISNSEVVLVKTGDVDAVKGILQSRVDFMVEGGAWYPATIEIWETTAQIVSHGNYVLLAVGETAGDIVASFNANVK